MHSNAHSTVLVVDDHPIVREGIRVLVDGHAGFTVVGEASTAREAIERLRTLKPALLTVDLSLGQGSGFEVLEALRVMDGGTGALVLSIHHQDGLVTRALDLGAGGFVAKGLAREHVLRGLCAVRDGERYVAVPRPEPERTRGHRILRDGQTEGLPVTLTPREAQVLKGIADGLTSAEIAARLGIGARTVDAHRHNLLDKLMARNKVDLLIRAIHAGLVVLPARSEVSPVSQRHRRPGRRAAT